MVNKFSNTSSNSGTSASLNHSRGINDLPSRATWRRAAASATEREMLQRAAELGEAVKQAEQKILSGSAQVTAVCTKVPTADLAGVPPHAPQRPGLRPLIKPDKDTGEFRINLRVKWQLKQRLIKRAEEAGSYPSAYALAILTAAPDLPPDTYATAKNKGIRDAYAANAVALNRVGGLLNQIATATHKHIPCALTRPEIDQLLADHAAACKAHLTLGQH